MTYYRYVKTTDRSLEEIVRLGKDKLQEIIECLNKDIDIGWGWKDLEKALGFYINHIND
jgi:hypothetical protein